MSKMWDKRITDICEFYRQTKLVEISNNDSYSTTVRWKTNTACYKINLSKIKEKSTFLRQDEDNDIKLPKDCDYIIFNPTLKKVFLIELKSKKSTQKPYEIEEQLKSGEKWWRHLTFCMGKDDECKDYEISKLVIYVRGGGGRGSHLLENPSGGYSYYRGYGKNVVLQFKGS